MRRTARERWCVGALVLCLLSGGATASRAGFVYDEAFDGDLPHPNSAFLIDFGTPGQNLVKFTVSSDDSDGWILQVDPGETLRSFTMTSFSPDSEVYSATFHMYDGPTQEDTVLGVAYSSFSLELEDVDFLEHFGIGPLGPGLYLFDFWHDNSPGPSMVFNIDMTGLSPIEEDSWSWIKNLYR